MIPISKYVKFSEQEIYDAAHKSIKDFLESQGETVLKSGTEYKWARHDSVKFRGHVFYRHSNGGEESGTAIDFLCTFYSMSFPDAVITLLDGKYGNKYTPTKTALPSYSPLYQKAKQPMVIPTKNETNRRVFAYLSKTRCIDSAIISYFMKQGLLYETKDTHNAVFIGKDKQGVIKYILQKGTLTDKPFQGEVKHSDKQYAFHHKGSGSSKLFIFESPIDMFSYIDLKLLKRKQDWKYYNYLALGGLSLLSLNQYLEDYPIIQHLCVCTDNDSAGHAVLEKVQDTYLKKGYAVYRECPKEKDWNDDLKQKKGVV